MSTIRLRGEQASSISTPRQDRYKLESELTNNTVTHRTIESDLSSGNRRTDVFTTWVHQRILGSGAFGQVSLQQERVSGQLRAVKIIALGQVRMTEIDALANLQDVRITLVVNVGCVRSVLRAIAS